MMRFLALLALIAASTAPAAAQDIRGMEVCTAEKQMDRRTSCLQANVDFLQQALAKATREMNAKLTAATNDLAAARAEIALLKSAVAKLESGLAELRTKVEAAAKK